jgi:DNA-binding NtrC family response regulator
MPNILVVDDDRLMVRTLCDVLRLRGWRPHGLHSAEDAVRAAESETFDVVLIDYRMSGMNGAEASRILSGAMPRATLILMTAFATSDLPADVGSCGVAAVLAKPFAPERLFELLDGVRGR